MTKATKELLDSELKNIPEDLLQEVLDYIVHLKATKSSYYNSIQTAVASEPVLARDWNKPEEDEAWKNL